MWQALQFLHFAKCEQNVMFFRNLKTLAQVGHLKRICKDAFYVAGAVPETCSAQMLGGQGTDFLRGVTFWHIEPSRLLKLFCVTGVALRMTWPHFSW